MPNQEAKAHRVGEWASLRNTSPEIAEAIFELAHYDEKLAEKIWEEGSDEVQRLPVLGRTNYRTQERVARTGTQYRLREFLHELPGGGAERLARATSAERLRPP